MFNLSFVELGDLCVKALHDLLLQLVGAERDAELVLCTIDNIDESLLNVIINFIHAEVQVFYLRILNSDPLLDFLTLFVDSFDGLDIV